MVYDSKSVKDTQKIAADLAKKISQAHLGTHARVVALEGELGAGKTVFVKAFAKDLGIKEKISSPTFVLLKSYRLEVTGYKLLIHIDTYRLKNYKDLLPLGIKEMINDPANIILIEWSDRVKPILPKTHTKVHIDHIGENKRSISIS